MKLYFAPGTCALACWIALEWAGADYEVQKVDPGSQSYLQVNPLGMVPALDIGGPRAMTQADAILHYIVERYAERDLGADPGLDAHFEFNEVMSFLTGDFHPAFWPFFQPERFTASEDAECIEAVRLATQPRVHRVLTYLNAQIGEGGHVYRGKRTVADAYAFVMARWSRRFPKTWQDYPRVAAFMHAMQADEAVRQVLERSAK